MFEHVTISLEWPYLKMSIYWVIFDTALFQALITFKLKYKIPFKCKEYRWIVYLDRGSVDRISLVLFTWSKVSVKFGVWSILWSFHLIEGSNNVILSYFKLSIMHLINRLKSCQLIETFINDLIKCKKRTYDFGTWSNVLLAKK